MWVGYQASMLMQNNLVSAAPPAICDKLSDRDTVAFHTGRILQSCAVVENGIFKMISFRDDVIEFNSIHRTKRLAFRNVMSEVRNAVTSSLEEKRTVFKNPKRLLVALTEFDKIAAFRSDLAHAEYVSSGEIDGIRVAILSNEGVEGATFQSRKVQIVSINDIIAIDKSAHRLANTLRQILHNQIKHKPKS
jgi:hypothetical protein